MTRTIWNTLATLAVLIFTALPLSAAEVVTYYHNDHLGSPIAATDSTGALVWQQAYDPWGFKLTANTDERGYTGNWLDEETGLADHKARWYTSSIGRFTGIDPVKWHESNIHSFNRYAYGNNNPYSYADPDGELAFPVVPILGVMALEALGIGLEVATMEETSDSINRSGAGTFGVTGVTAVSSTMRMGLKGANATKSATQIAREGGRHSGQLNQFMKQTPEQLQKTIKSFDKQIAKHERWINDPASKVRNFNQLRPEHQRNLIHHWRQDIVRHKELKSIAKDVLRGT